jgi:3-oxoadipate enol-lactonase
MLDIQEGSQRIFYQIHNPNDLKTRPLVLLHGLGSSGEDWPVQVGFFARSFPVLTIDLCGHGRSSMGSGWLTIGDFARDVALLLQELDHRQVHLLGFSLGAAVALQLTIDYPEHVRSITLVNGFAKFQINRKGSVQALGRLVCLAIGRMDWLGAWIARGIFPAQDQAEWREIASARIAANPRGQYVRAVGAILRFNALSRLDDVRAPTLIIAGERDTTIGMKSKQALARGIPGAKLVSFPASGHGTPYDAADRLNEITLDFLLRVERAA